MIKQLNINWLIEFAGSTDEIVICKLPTSKLFRIPFLPERYQVDEVYEVLGTLCKRYKQGMWFFLFDEDDLTTFKETLAYMGIEFLAIHEPFPAPEENMN